MSIIDQILTNPAWRVTAYAVLVAIGYAIGNAVYLILCAEARYRAQRKADQIAKEMNVARNLRGMR